MKKSMSIIIPVIIIMLVAALCGSSYYLFYRGMTQNNPNMEGQRSNIVFQVEEYPRIMSTYSMENLINKYYESFTGAIRDESCGNEDEILQKLINGEIDIAILPELTEEQIDTVTNSGMQFESIALTKDALVFLTSGTSSITNLTTNDIRKIYSGEVENWIDIGGDDLEISAYQKPSGSSIQELMIDKVMQGTEMKSSIKENLIGDDIAVADLNSEYYNEEGRIGYTLYNYYNIMYNDISDGALDADKLISVDNIAPTIENIQNNTYPYTITYYIIFSSSQPQGGNVRRWISSVLSEEGKNITREAGYIAN